MVTGILARPMPHLFQTGREHFDVCRRAHAGATLSVFTSTPKNAIDRAGRETAGWSLFLQLATKNCSSRRTRFREGNAPPEGSKPSRHKRAYQPPSSGRAHAPSLRQATLPTDNERLPSVTFLGEATGGSIFDAD
jgi:hypothetical protein